MKRIGVQLYTVRDLLGTKNEIHGTLAEIKKIGYDSVQLFGSLEFAQACAEGAKANGLAITGALLEMNTCEANEQALFKLCRSYQIKDIGISSGFSDCAEPDAYIGRVNAFARRAKDAGFTFSYHNHSHEFIALASGEIPMERFLEGFDPETVDFMPDTYWIHDGGCDVRHFLERTKGRVKILHVKDMKRIEQGHTFAEVGNGNLYFAGIIKTALDCGIEHFVVEQDICPGNPIDSLAQSYKTIKALLEA